MLLFLQLFFALFAIVSALSLPEEMKLYIPLGCLVFMFIIGRLDRQRLEKSKARKSYLKSEIDKIHGKDAGAEREGDFFTIESLLWPKSEMLLTDAVHSVFKELGFKISTGIKNPLVDRLITLPDTQKMFGLEILMVEREVEIDHPKVRRALQFQKEKKGNEKTLIIAGTHVRIPLSERESVNHLSKELVNLLLQNDILFMPCHHLYQLWQKAKKGETDIHDVFERIHAQAGGPVQLKGL